MNMSFKNWLFSEIADILQRDTSHIKLEKNGAYYTYYFRVNGQNFKFMAEIFKYNYNMNSVSISFSGNDGHKLTGTSKNSGSAVYSQILLAIKKLLEIEPIDYISFSAADIQMAPIYERFFNKFLSNEFIHYDKYGYIRRTKLKEILQNSSEEEKKTIYKNMISAKRNKRDDTKEAQLKKANKQQFVKKFNTIVNHHGIPAFIYGLQGNKVLMLSKGSLEGMNTLALRKIVYDKNSYTETTPEQAREFITLAAKNTNPYVSEFIHSQQGAKLKDMIVQNGYNLRNIPQELMAKINDFVYVGKKIAFLTKVSWQDNQAEVFQNSTGVYSHAYPNLTTIDMNSFPARSEIHNFLTGIAGHAQMYQMKPLDWVTKNMPQLLDYFKKYHLNI